MHWVFLILSNYLTFFQTLLFPSISGTFKPLVHWDLLVHWQTWTKKKREKKRKSRNSQLVLILPEHSARTLIKWEKKGKSEKEKDTGRVEGKRKILRKKGEYGELPFWEYWVLPRNNKWLLSSLASFDSKLLFKFLDKIVLYDDGAWLKIP